ncbi:hypothetical protein ACFLZM_07565 [Thermodesulfobacteriota bacterium]
MYLKSKKLAYIPGLAWLLSYKLGDDEVHVIHGPKVESGKDHVIEGAWDGDFSSMQFDKSVLLMGSGCFIRNGFLVIATATHTLSKVITLRSCYGMIISNSLPFLLAWTGENLDNRHIFYNAELSSIMFGLYKCKKTIHTASRKRIIGL